MSEVTKPTPGVMSNKNYTILIIVSVLLAVAAIGTGIVLIKP